MLKTQNPKQIPKIEQKTEQQVQMEIRIDALNDKRFELQFQIAALVSDLIQVKWDSPTVQKELVSLVRENHKNWNDIFEAEELAGHDMDYCTCKDLYECQCAN